jgi:hypothetical protein
LLIEIMLIDAPLRPQFWLLEQLAMRISSACDFAYALSAGPGPT